MMWKYESGYRPANQHDAIQRHLVREFREYSKQHLKGVSWTGSRRNNDHKADDVYQAEKRFSGDLPSGKSYCRADVALTVGDTAFAFEIKTSASDAKNWPEQARDYRANDHVPVIVVTPEVVADLAPGHRLVTDSEHGYASENRIYFKSDRLPQSLKNHFSTGTVVGKIHDHCPECGFSLKYRQFTDELVHRCMACGWDDFK